MAKFTNPLDGIRVASPCSADWDAMIGNNRQRHCGECKLDVYNLSGMTKREAENLIMNSEGRLCARFFRRADGTIITKDCPVGWAAVKKKMSRVWTAVAAVFVTAVSSIGITAFVNQKSSSNAVTGLISITRTPPPTNDPQPLMGAIPLEPNQQPEEIMGDIAYPEEHPNDVMGKIKVDP
ncbi:MAG: hypothetical protein HKN25_13490 [Pyrinomonadaceae bacterium]|nr:hypothetical protein [Pyrinomonadaceae bacterium]